MSAEPSEVLRAGMELLPADRESVALTLLDSLADDIDDGAVKAAWRVETDRRVTEIRDGSIVGESWPTVRVKVADRLDSKRR